MECNCYFCGTELNWIEDQDKESYGYQGKGIVVNLTCPNCGAEVIFIENKGDVENV